MVVLGTPQQRPVLEGLTQLSKKWLGSFSTETDNVCYALLHLGTAIILLILVSGKFLNKSTWIKTMRLCFVSCQVAKLIIMVQELPQERMQTALQEQTGKEYVIPNLDEDDGGGTLSSWTRYNSLIRQGTALIAIVIVIIIIFELKKVVVSCKNILHNIISLDKVA